MEIDRRALLIGAAAVSGGLVLGAVGKANDWWDIEILGTPEPDATAERVAVQTEARLIKAYDSALSVYGSAEVALVDRMRSFRIHHQDHLAALGGGDRDVEAAPAPGQGGTDTATVQPLPTDPAALAPYFAEQEQRWAAQAAVGAQISGGGELARLFALIGASEATHVAAWSDG